MRSPKSALWLAVAAALLLGLVALFATTSSAFALTTHALFVATDKPAANEIVVYDRAANGSLTLAATYFTGGKGGVTAASVVDPLASQASLMTAEGGRCCSP